MINLKSKSIKVKKVLLVLLFFSVCAIHAQNWESLDYSPDQKGLEYNPLKGFTTLWNPSNNFPHSLMGKIFGLKDIMTGMSEFNWSAIDNFISTEASKGNFSRILVIIDPANGTTLLPDFLVDQVDWEIHPDDRVPDWNNEILMQAMLNFIAAYGERYNGDDRIFSITFGLYGMWGEWHVGDYKTFEMTSANTHRLSNAYLQAFPNTKLMARYPNLPDNQVVGYSDGLFFSQSIDPSNPWYFHNRLKSAKADQNWKLHPIGGEIDPSLQSEIWSSWPNTIGQDVTACFDSIHPSYLISHFVLTMDSASNVTKWDNALRAQKMMGYTLYINNYRLSANAGKVSVETSIRNQGIAPMYADWDVEIGVLDSNDQFTSLGTENWKISNIIPDDIDYYRAFTSNSMLDDGRYKVLLRVINPMEAISMKAKPLRFANTSQDEDRFGWITLGRMEISGGNYGEPPIRVTGLSMPDDTISLTVGESTILFADVSPENAGRKDLTWVSDHPATASVDSNGLVLAGPLSGHARIYAYTQDGGYKTDLIIHVEPFWFDIPDRVEAEDYMNQSGVQTENCSDTDGGLNVGWIETGDWMEYPIRNNTNSDYFLVSFRLSSPSSTGLISVFLDDVLIGELYVPYTGSWQSWKTVIDNLKIEQGNHILKIVAKAGGFNINYFDFETESEPGRSAYGGIPWHFPGDSVLAWQYDFIHFQSSDIYFSMDTAQTIGIYGCGDTSGLNIRSYKDSKEHSDAGQFYWDQSAETFQINGQWVEYKAEFTNNTSYQLLIKAKINVDVNFKVSISALDGEKVYYRDFNLQDDFFNSETHEEQTDWFISHFPLEIPLGVFIVKFDWYDQVGEPGIFGGFAFIESNTNVITNQDITEEFISIYPNPSDGIMIIDIDNLFNANIEIFNINGMMIYSKPQISTHSQINLNAYPKGLYYVKVKLQEVVKVVKVVVE